MTTVFNLVERQAELFKNKIAILGTNGFQCSYKELFTQTQYTHQVLQTYGIRRNEPVAIVIPNGHLMAAAFLSIASGAASAPLNPAYTAEEYEFYLSDLNAKAVIIETGFDNPIVSVAHKLQIPVIRINLNAEKNEGLFSLADEKRQNNRNKIIAAPKQTDIALILHTSGTTSRPKMVPLTQKNLFTSANNISKTLQLTPDDRCLNIMPLFHIHGLMAGFLANIASGGSVICSPGFYAPQFFKWIDEFQPTWYTAVPTMHQSILHRAKDNSDIIKKSKIRLIRSSSASLSPSVMKEIEETFHAPLIEAYGMTEAAHQMASNPLPPSLRKPGSVGLPAGSDIAIMHEKNAVLLPNGEKGEIVIQGIMSRLVISITLRLIKNLIRRVGSGLVTKVTLTRTVTSLSRAGLKKLSTVVVRIFLPTKLTRCSLCILEFSRLSHLASQINI